MSTENAVGRPQTFEERMMDLFRANVGNLMTQTELKSITERALEKTFFERAKNPAWANAYSHERRSISEHLPSLGETMAKTLLEEAVKNQVAQWFVDNQEKVATMLNGVLREGIAQCVLNAMEARLQSAFHEFQLKATYEIEQLKSKLR